MHTESTCPLLPLIADKCQPTTDGHQLAGRGLQTGVGVEYVVLIGARPVDFRGDETPIRIGSRSHSPPTSRQTTCADGSPTIERKWSMLRMWLADRPSWNG